MVHSRSAEGHRPHCARWAGSRFALPSNGMYFTPIYPFADFSPAPPFPSVDWSARPRSLRHWDELDSEDDTSSTEEMPRLENAPLVEKDISMSHII